MFKVLHFPSGTPAGVPVADPFAEVHMLKTWARIGVYAIILVFGAVDYYVWGLSVVQMLYVRVASVAVATGAIEVIFHQSLKLRKRSAYPARVLVEAGASDSLSEAATTVLGVLRQLLHIRAGALLTGSGGAAEVLASEGWSDEVVASVAAELTLVLESCAASQSPVLLPASDGLISAGLCNEGEVVVVTPLVAFSQCVGVAVAVGGRRNRDLADLELMRGIGNATGVALESLRQKDEIEAKEERLRAVVTAAPIMLFRIDAGGVFTLIEGKALERLQIVPDRVVGRSLQDVFAGRPAIIAAFQQALAGETIRTVVDLGGMFLEAELCPIRDTGGNVTTVIGVATDVTERKQAEDTIRHMAFHDSLTGLPNRELFERTLTESLGVARDAGSLLAVLFVDLDGFKEVNDTIGHAEGDRLLREVAALLLGLVREGEFVARIGGDEFLVLLPKIATTEEATNASDRILDGLQVEWAVGGERFRLTASIGVAVYPHDGTDGSDLLRSADRAMYQAKSQGRGRYALVSSLTA
jgi:diguanylate cyclase (GGDEF)-like protein/PAS domain S-box-containing protein